ncbi:MotA/TolQ/ExbB proton channel family protein [Pararobbsia silviterrae]|uniref:Biopolymer transport protein ExbB n=1 Tax=Pararobbsia silviterrae TaxID=1792498 RepID=A0A494Y6T0_9BURK|nr:MotA/TolQ/ExbB proton channel family protein [Pararobbsia silviterrae]RKP57782.1 MotA/TolQ/ExbB proton channel family protein [Pararobbsia silviterrae]
MNHYGFINVWQQGDFVTRAIVIALAAMSIASWSVLLIRLVAVSRLRAMTATMRRAFWSAADFDAGIANLGPSIANPYRDLALAAREASEQRFDDQAMLYGSLDANEWMSRCLKDVFDDHVARLQGGLAVLASIGSTAPFVGLFGTVWGIYHALVSIGESGTASLDHVAGPVGESLVMTAFGLFVAIPAVLGYNAASRGNKAVIHRMMRFMHELHGYFIVGNSPSAPRRPSANAPAAATVRAAKTDDALAAAPDAVARRANGDGGTPLAATTH